MCPLIIFLLSLLRYFHHVFSRPSHSCILLNSFAADHKFISYPHSLSTHILSLYFFILPQSLLLFSNNFHRSYHCFSSISFSDKCCSAHVSIPLKYYPNSSLWLWHAFMQDSSRTFLLFKIKWFSISICCSLQRSFLLWLPSQQIIHLVCSHSLSLH